MIYCRSFMAAVLELIERPSYSVRCDTDCLKAYWHCCNWTSSKHALWCSEV